MQLFEDSYELSAPDLLQALDYLTTLALDYEEYERSLPALALMEYVSRTGCFSNGYLLKSKLRQSISLANMGYIQEAIALYYSVTSKKDSLQLASRTSTYRELSAGIYSANYDGLFNNGLPLYEEPNKKTLSDLLGEELDKGGFETVQLALARYAKCVVLFRVYESEPVTGDDAVERQDERCRAMRHVEEELRDNLKVLSRVEEIARKKHEVELELMRVEAGAEKTEALEKKLKDIERAREEEKISVEVSGESEYIDTKNEILTLMVHCRLLMMKILQAQGLYNDAYNVGNTGLEYLRKYCWGVSRIETGTDIKSEVEMVPEGVVAGIGAPGKDPKKPGKPAAKEEKKKADPRKKQNVQEITKENEEKLAEERKREEILAEERSKSAECREHVNAYLWFRLRYEVLNNIYLQEKYDDCEVLAKLILEDSDELKDSYFKRQAQQILCYVLARKGKTEEAEKCFEGILKNVKSNEQGDVQFAYFLANFAELMYKYKKDIKKVTGHFKDARRILWQALKYRGLELTPVDINSGNYRSGTFIDPRGQLKADDYFQGGEKIVPELVQGPQEEAFDYSKELTPSLQYPDKAKNSSYVEPKIYLLGLEQLVKIDIRYATAVIANGDAETALRVLNDTVALCKRTLNVPPALSFTVLLLLAVANKLVFKAKLQTFAASYIEKAKSNRKYKDFVDKLPYGNELPLGVELFKLPTFAHNLQEEYWKFIESGYQYVKEAAELLNSESVLLFDFDERLNPSRAFTEYADICRLMGEYCPRRLHLFTAKYADCLKERVREESGELGEEELEREVKSEVEREEREWKAEREKYAAEAVSALSQAVKCEKMRKLLVDGYSELSQTTLIDPSRAPKDVICEIFESDYHFKKLYKQLPSIEARPKTALSSADVLAYFVTLSNELRFFTFGKEVMARRLPKLHRYLKSNLSTYSSQCCIAFKPSPAESPNLCLSCWSLDFSAGRSTSLHVLGPAEAGSRENFLGECAVESKELSGLYQDAQELLKEFVAASAKSAEIFARDKEKIRPRYDEIIKRIGDLFAPRGVVETFKVETPEFTAKNLNDLVQYLGVYGISMEHKELCKLLRLYHRIRYKVPVDIVT